MSVESTPLLTTGKLAKLVVYTDEEDLVTRVPDSSGQPDGCSHSAGGREYHRNVNGKDMYSDWGGTPSVRKMWTKNAPFGFSNRCQQGVVAGPQLMMTGCTLEKLTGLIIALMLNLFLSMSFGQAFFPADWDFAASGIPREIGAQMFLFSTLLCQLVMTSFSDFPCAMGMMMVENIPFMHTIATHVQHRHGCGAVGMATVLAAFATSSVVVGALFFILGAYKLGNAVYFFPKHVILGCIGGVGIFVIITGFEVSSNLTWSWDSDGVDAFTATAVVPLWISSCAYCVVLRVLIARYHIAILPPIFFVMIPPTFYFFLWASGISSDIAHQYNWFFESSREKQDPFLMWEIMKLDHVHWGTIAELTPTIIALTLFSLMHVPINIPSLSVSTKVTVDINKELKAHGISNILVGLLGGCQNYTCYSNSFLYFKCGGGGLLSGYLLSALTGCFFLYGPEAIRYVPRCMAGCLLIHVGIDLFVEGLVDSFKGSDNFEYATLVIIAFVMTIYGMTAGLGAGIVLAALTFTMQTSRHVSPIRGIMRATTLRSSAWRSSIVSRILLKNSSHIAVIQLHGHLFFGNATLLKEEIERLLLNNQSTNGMEIYSRLRY